MGLGSQKTKEQYLFTLMDFFCEHLKSVLYFALMNFICLMSEQSLEA